MMVLSSGTSVINLPSAQFGDLINRQQSVKEHRTVRGRTFFYVKAKGRLKLIFKILMTRTKSQELEIFLESHIADTIRLTDHNDKTWIGSIVNNPIETAAKFPDEMSEIGIEFEGNLL